MKLSADRMFQLMALLSEMHPHGPRPKMGMNEPYEPTSPMVAMAAMHDFEDQPATDEGEQNARTEYLMRGGPFPYPQNMDETYEEAVKRTNADALARALEGKPNSRLPRRERKR